VSKRSRRYFSAEQKVTLLKRHHLDKVPISDICDQEKLQPSSMYQWQRQLFENAGVVFEAPQNSKPSREQELEARIAQLEAKLTKKDEVIAEISEEYVRLKKGFGGL
jgi:transposase